MEKVKKKWIGACQLWRAANRSVVLFVRIAAVPLGLTAEPSMESRRGRVVVHDDEGRSIAMNEEKEDLEAGSFRPTYAAVTRGVGVQEDEGHQDGRHARDSESKTKGGAMEDSSMMLSIRTPCEQQGSEAAVGEYAVETDPCSPFNADRDIMPKMVMRSPGELRAGARDNRTQTGIGPAASSPWWRS